MATDNHTNETRANEQAHKIFVEETLARIAREQAVHTAPPQPPFIPLTAEKIREQANAMRKRMGLPPLP